MKKLFERKKKDNNDDPELTGSSWSIYNYNFSNLPPITVVRSQEDQFLSDTFRGLPTLPFDRIILHCYRALTPHHVALIYELRRVVVPNESVIFLFHHKRGKVAKRWCNAMRLIGFRSRHKSSDNFISVWEGPTDFEMPRCKTERSLEEQSSRFYQTLLRDTKRVLEVFPRVGSISKKALALGIPITVFFSSDKEKSPISFIQHFGGQFS